MNWSSTTSPSEHETDGRILLIPARERAAHSVCAVADGLLCVELPAPGPATRGRLALLIESAIESALEQRGAAPPGVGASSDLDASLSDQLYRARQVGKHGLALCIPSLEGIANLAGSLDAEDSAVLRWWFAAARERNVHLLLDAADRHLGVYGPPAPLHVLIAERHEPATRAAEVPQAAPEVAASAAAMELSAPPPSVVDQDRELESAPPVGLETEAARAGEQPAELTASRGQEAADDPLPDWITETPPPERQLVPVDLEALSEPPPDVLPESEDELDEAPPLLDKAPAVTTADLASAMAALFEGEDVPRADAPEPDVITDIPAGTGAVYEGWAAQVESITNEDADVIKDAPTDTPQGAEDLGSGEPAPVTEAQPIHPQAREQWRSWVRELSSARGPKPLAIIERLFVSAYVPLADAAARGIANHEADAALSTWASSFEKSYSEAFDALRLRGKRPTMVLDVPDVALRIGRLHGARSVQLLLVDGLRFDLGLRVQDRLKVLLGRRAALTERLLLWSALPSITSVQLELIGRGPQGLRELGRSPESEAPVARGRSAKTLRRIKAGHREIMKLDLVEARLSEPGGPAAQRLDAIADETAECVANHFLHLPPRTLVMLFGDHGFQFDPLDQGTSAARQGGASPEEVLVPAFAWLVGEVH